MPGTHQIYNQRGVALLYLIILFTLIGVLVSAGVRQFGSKVNLGKIKDTKAELERDAQMITAWAVKKGKLPANSADYFSVFGTTPPLDSWGKEITYLYDANASTGEFCGRTSSATQYGGANVGFILISGGDDSTINSTPSATASVASLPVGNYGGLSSSDLYRVVFLDELKSKAGCDGPTQGSLKIINNELPSVCVGSTSYSAVVHAVGGVPINGTKDNYSWLMVVRPSWMTPAVYDGPAFTTITTPLQLGVNGTVPITPQTYPITLAVKDGDTLPNEVRKSYSIKATILGSCSSTCFSDSTCRASFVANSPCFTACFADINCSKACSDNSNCVNDCNSDVACSTAYLNRAQ
jgi:hypothetical protein